MSNEYSKSKMSTITDSADWANRRILEILMMAQKLQKAKAAMKGDTQVVQRILSSSVVESIVSPNFVRLIFFLLLSCSSATESLLSYFAIQNGNSALMLASEEGHADVVRILLNNNYASARVEDKVYIYYGPNINKNCYVI